MCLQPWVEFFTSKVMEHPLTNTPATKESFIPSTHERKKVWANVQSKHMLQGVLFCCKTIVKLVSFPYRLVVLGLCSSTISKFSDCMATLCYCKLSDLQVSKLVHAIKMGWLKPRVEEKVTEEPDKVMTRKYYELWAKEDSVSIGHDFFSRPDICCATIHSMLCCQL